MCHTAQYDKSSNHCRVASPRLFTRADGIISLAVGLAALSIYIPTLAPGLLIADMGEFQTLAVTLGYAHPTGYPVYLLLAKLATLIPLADYAYRVNLFSAIAAAIAVALMYLLARLATGARWAAVAGALALGVSPTFWSRAVMAGVYSTSMVFVIGVLLALGVWQKTHRTRWLFTAACLGGISIGVHTLVVFGAPAAVFLVAFDWRRWKTNWAAALGGALTGCVITLAAYAVVDWADSPCGNFHVVIDPSRSEWNLRAEDTDGFLERVRLSLGAPQFRGMLFSQSPQRTLEKTGQYLTNLRRELPPIWLVLAGAGFGWLAWRNSPLLVLLAFTYVVHLAFNLQFDGLVYIKYMATYVPLAVFGVAGLAWAAEVCGKVIPRLGQHEASSPVADCLWGAVGVAVVIWPMVWPAAWNPEGRRECWVPPEESDTPFRVEYSAALQADVRRLISALEDDAILFTGWNYIYPYYYVAHLEQGRTGIVVLFDYPTANHFELADSAVAYVKHVRAVAPNRPIYFTHIVRKIADVYELVPVYRGLEKLYRVGKPIGAGATLLQGQGPAQSLRPV